MMLGNLPPQILSIISDAAKKACIETGHVCPHWMDEGIYNELHFWDKKNGGNKAEEYFKKCHEVVVFFNQGTNFEEKKMRIKCQPNNVRSFEKCDYCNPKAEEMLLKQFNQGENHDNNNT